MIYIFILVFVVLALIVAVVGRKSTAQKTSEAMTARAVALEQHERYMSDESHALCEALRGVLKEKYLLFTNVRMEDFLHMITKTDPSQKFGLRKRVHSKYVDFLICDTSLRPLMAVELDERSDTKEVRRGDKLKDSTYEHLGLPMRRVGIRAHFSDEMEGIMESLRATQSAPR